MFLPQLILIAPPPQKPIETGSPKAWETVQERLGIPLPDDYKVFIDRYGTGSFNGFIIPYNPFAVNEYFNLFQALDAHHLASRQTQLMADTTWSAVSPFELYPAPDGLLPWGTTTNFGDTFFWQISGPPETWVTIFYNLRTGEYEVWKMTFTSFLTKLLFGEIESVLIHEDLLPKGQQIAFQPYNCSLFEDWERR
jgi:hypothetical protein